MNEKENGKRTALVTGAGRGIGRAAARELARRGFDVIVNYAENTAAAEETVRLCRAYGTEALALQADVSEEAAVKAMVSTGVERFGGIDALVNNAGITRDQLLLRTSAADFDLVILKNLRGAFLLTREVLPSMLRRRYGRIINVSSIVGLHGNAGQAAYASSKSGLIGLTKTTALEYAKYGITANAVAPGFIDTDMTRALPEKVRGTLLAQIPARRLGRPEEAAAAIAFLASEEAGYISGQVLGVDGGMGC